MKDRIKKLWVNALRSGDYKQGQGRLRSKTNEFCCLGVLCNIYAQKNPSAVRGESSPTRLFTSYDFLPAQVQDWAGLNSSDPRTGENRLSMLNDTGASFYEIALVIQRHL